MTINFTSRLGLTKDTIDEDYDVDRVNANSDKIDANIGVIVCTSSTRPSTPYNGMKIYETDTGLEGLWRSDLSAWVTSRSTIYASSTRPTTGLYEGYMFYRTDRDWLEVYDGSAWRVHGTAVCSSTADRDSAITHPYSGQLAYVSSTGRIYQRHGGVWREMPGAVPVAQMRQTSTQSLTDSTFTDITFTTEDFDALGGHSTVTNPARFTAPIAGIYEFSGGVAIAANATGLRVCQWALNGNALPASDNSQVSVGAGSATRMVARTYQVSMAVGDYVTLQGWQGSGGFLNTVAAGAAASSMTVKFLGG